MSINPIKNSSSSEAIAGFTLMELLIALSIFTLISMMLLGGLRTVINTLARTEQNAEQLRDMQHVLLKLSRDIEQMIKRPILLGEGKEEAAMIGKTNACTFTHVGAGAQYGGERKSALKRVRYLFDGGSLYKEHWPVLDRAPGTKSFKVEMLSKIKNASFAYLDEAGESHREWPLEDGKQALPLAIKIAFTIEGLGEIKQVYLIPARESKSDKQKEQPE